MGRRPNPFDDDFFYCATNGRISENGSSLLVPQNEKKLKEKNGKLKRNVGDRLNEMDPFHFFKSKVNGPTRRNDNGFGFFSFFSAVFFLKKRMELERQSHVGRLNENGPTSTKKKEKRRR